MENKTVSHVERIEEVLRVVETETGMRASNDSYPCFLRVGDNWSEYPFNWEPFRDLAEPIKWPKDAPLIVMISTKEPLTEPKIVTHQEPHAHNRIMIYPGTPVVAIIEQWIGQIAPYIPAQTKSREFFLKGLSLKPSDVSIDVQRFLGLESATEKRPIELSATVRGIAKDIGDRQVSAFEITEKLKEKHGEYASYRLGQADWETPSNPDKNSWKKWRDSVAELYDKDTVAKSHHKVIDGRLFLVGLGLYAQPLRKALTEKDVWAPLLLEIDEAVIPTGGPLRNALNEIQLAHGYQCDRPDGDDQLGIQGEVNAVCEVIMDPDVKPPLAIGLFGAWGSGKSFFMEKMRERVYELTQKPQENRPKNVVQIRFNAWHYADTSLWASLAVEIFERLADPEPVPTKAREDWLKTLGDPNKAEREKLITNLETYRQAKAELQREIDHLEAEKMRLGKEREEAEGKRKNAVENATFTNVAAELIKDKEIEKGLNEISINLGMKPAIDQLTGIANELQTASGYITAIWRKIDNKNWTAGLLITAIVLLVFTATVGIEVPGAWYGSLLTACGSIVSALVAASNHILPAVKNVNKALGVVASTMEKISQARENLLAKRSKEEQALELEIAVHNEQIDEATRSIAALNEKITTIAAKADALSVGRRLYDFLADRAAGYKKHQGIVGMLHRDFRLLNAQLMAHSAAEKKAGLPKIERVVLYIDDLDRCPPEKVLEVLEAVHLLLALELFIVVVGVDPSWLLRSLRHQYKDLCLASDPSNDPYLHTMPIEYLEKIFQIPLTLPAMEVKGYRKLISSLSPKTSLPPTEEKPAASVGPSRRAASPGSPGGTKAPTRALLQVQVGSAAHGTGAETIDLTSDEVLFVQQLGGLVDTPRAAKRLMNTYRLIRATQHVGSRSRFLGADGKAGEYYAVLTLLAIAAGFPTLVDRVLVMLEEYKGKSKMSGWKIFVNKLNPDIKNDVSDDGVLKNEEDRLSKTDETKWANMYNVLKNSINDNELHDIEPYQRWGRTVARFSFTL
jgi:hypothetical protein